MKLLLTEEDLLFQFWDPRNCTVEKSVGNTYTVVDHNIQKGIAVSEKTGDQGLIEAEAWLLGQ